MAVPPEQEPEPGLVRVRSRGGDRVEAHRDEDLVVVPREVAQGDDPVVADLDGAEPVGGQLPVAVDDVAGLVDRVDRGPVEIETDVRDDPVDVPDGDTHVGLVAVPVHDDDGQGLRAAELGLGQVEVEGVLGDQPPPVRAQTGDPFVVIADPEADLRHAVGVAHPTGHVHEALRRAGGAERFADAVPDLDRGVAARGVRRRGHHRRGHHRHHRHDQGRDRSHHQPPPPHCAA